MNTIISVLVVGILLFMAYKFNVFAGLALSVIVLGLCVYMFLPAYYRSKGARCFDEGDYKGAKNWYEKAINTKRAKSDIRIEYSYILMRTGDINRAERVLDELLRYKMKPETKARAIVQRCMCYYKKGMLDEAVADGMELYDSGIRTTMLYGMLGFFKIVKAPMAQETFDFCMEAMDYADDDRDIMDNMFICYYNRGEYEKAKELSDKILSCQPKFIEAWYHGAQLDYKMGNYEEASEKLERIKDCNRSYMTTVSEEEIAELASKVGSRLRSRR